MCNQAPCLSVLLCFLKFFRCENPSQRLLGINMMSGLLKKREQAVSLEAYSVIATPYPHSCAPTLTSKGVIAETKMTNSDDIMKSDYGRLHLAFSTVFNHTVVTIAQSISESSAKSPEERSLLMSRWIQKLSELDEAARLRYSRMHCHDPYPHTKLSHAMPTPHRFMPLCSAMACQACLPIQKAHTAQLILLKRSTYALQL